MDAKDLFQLLRSECKKNGDCDTCPFCELLCSADSARRFSDRYFENILDETIRVAESLTHVKTFADDFFEKFPNAKRVNGGTPAPCRDDVYGVKSASCVSMDCPHCWNEPYEEMEK